MENSVVLPDIRIRKIALTDFRNITHSEVDIPGGKCSDLENGSSSILGLYGQNGSGKTSLLLAISALRSALTGTEFLFSEFSSCIRSGCEKARLEFELSGRNEKGNDFEIFYSFSMAIDENLDVAHTEEKIYEDDLDFGNISDLYSDKGKELITEYVRPKDRRILIFDELLQYSVQSPDGKKVNKQVLIDTSDEACNVSGKTFGNKTKYEQLTANCDDGIDEFLYRSKIKANVGATSFIFSAPVVRTLIKGSSKVSHKIILSALKEYGDNYLYVIGMSQTGTNSLKMLPLSLWATYDDGKAYGGNVLLSLLGHCEASDDEFKVIQLCMPSISSVISKIVPGLSLEINDIGKSISEHGEETHLFDLLSIRNGIKIPLEYESDGIRRILSFLSLIIAVYNNPSVTVAIDEIDSGIFEFMLGEILNILNENAKGQLIFTSHNFRPIEVLPNKNLLFTTVNPDNRYSKLENVSGNNNQRDKYLKCIRLGGGKDALYASTDEYDIEQALFEAGMPVEDKE